MGQSHIGDLSFPNIGEFGCLTAGLSWCYIHSAQFVVTKLMRNANECVFVSGEFLKRD